MINPFDHLDKVLQHSVRLQILSVLIATESGDFNSIKELLALTDGSLATHIKALERQKYISVIKSFVDRKPNTRYKATEKGRTAFKKHLEAMEEVIKQQKK